MPIDCHMYYMPNFHDFHIETIHFLYTLNMWNVITFYCLLSLRCINNLYGVGESTIRKYTKVVCGVLASWYRFYERYIHALTWHKLQEIIEKFKDVTGLPNVCGAIDGSHIPLFEKPSRCYIPYFFCIKFFLQKNFIA